MGWLILRSTYDTDIHRYGIMAQQIRTHTTNICLWMSHPSPTLDSEYAASIDATCNIPLQPKCHLSSGRMVLFLAQNGQNISSRKVWLRLRESCKTRKASSHICKTSTAVWTKMRQVLRERESVVSTCFKIASLPSGVYRPATGRA